MPKIIKLGKSLAVIIPQHIVDMQRIYPGTVYDAIPEGHGRIIFERVMQVRTPPTGSMWTVVKA